jgi:hypothetical protein
MSALRSRGSVVSQSVQHLPGERGWTVGGPDEKPNKRTPPDWAIDRATEELPHPEDLSMLEERGWEILRIADEQYDERHDEYDDPDQGGEA